MSVFGTFLDKSKILTVVGFVTILAIIIGTSILIHHKLVQYSDLPAANIAAMEHLNQVSALRETLIALGFELRDAQQHLSAETVSLYDTIPHTIRTSRTDTVVLLNSDTDPTRVKTLTEVADALSTMSSIISHVTEVVVDDADEARDQLATVVAIQQDAVRSLVALEELHTATYLETLRLSERTIQSVIQTVTNIAIVGGVTCAAIAFLVITKLIFTEKQMAIERENTIRHATRDSLTGLYNRRVFEEELKGLQPDTTNVLMFLDLDRFKIVNDTCGHAAGDQLLKQVTATISTLIRGSDFLARLGGDEFAVIFRDCPVSKAEALANTIRKSVEDVRFTWGDNIFTISVSVGLVEIPGTFTSINEMMVAVDMACFASKDGGRNRVTVFSHSDMQHQSSQMLQLPKITKALNENRFVLFHQLIVPLCSSTTTPNHEILIRMVDEDGKLIMPGTFLPIAERYERMGSIDRWVIRNTLEFNKQYRVPTSPSITFINISGVSLNDPTFRNFLFDTIAEYEIDPGTICLEITETVAINRIDVAASLINAVRDLGCKVALDDFGAGMSSFWYLKNLPVDFIKIDGALITGITNSVPTQVMVRSIHEIARSIGAQTIAEFVEDEATLNTLETIGVDFVQGYHLSHPTQLRKGHEAS